MKNIFKDVIHKVDANKSEILIGLGIAGFVSSMILVAKGSIKAHYILKELDEETPPVEKVKKTWHCYAPAGVCATLSAGAILAGAVINHKEKAGLLAMYAVSESARVTYKEISESTMTTEQKEEVKTKVADENSVNKVDTHLHITDTTKIPVKEPVSNQMFYASVHEIKDAVMRINDNYLDVDGYCTVTDLCYELGIDESWSTSRLGWSINNGHLYVSLEPKSDKDHRPYVEITYSTDPGEDYDT